VSKYTIFGTHHTGGERKRMREKEINLKFWAKILGPANNTRQLF
jgi:hypothetical protein